MSALLTQVRDIMRTRRYSLETEKTYIYWIRKYIFFHEVRHPKEMGAEEVGAFLTHLAVTENVAATQNQAWNFHLRAEILNSPSFIILARFFSPSWGGVIDN